MDLVDPVDLGDLPEVADVGVLVLGSLNVDHLARVRRLPFAGETVIADGYVIQAGGKGLNQAVAIATLGARVALVGAIGSDPGAAVVRDNLSTHGVDITHLVTAAHTSTGLAFVTVDAQGENTIVVHPGANASAPRLPASTLTDGRHSVLLCSLEVPLSVVADASARARAEGLVTIVNAAPMRGLDDGTLSSVLTNTDVLVVNESEARQLVGAAAGDTAELGRLLLSWRSDTSPQVVLTLGAGGALVLGPEGSRRVPAPVVRATNTVGAGDTFAGMLAVGIGAGCSLANAAALACAAGAIAVSSPETLSLQAVLELYQPG